MAESTFRNMDFTPCRHKGAMSLCLFRSRWQGGISHDTWPRNFGEQVSESRRLMRLVHQAPGCYLKPACLEKDTALKFGLEVLPSYLLMSYWWYWGEREEDGKHPTISLSPLITLCSFPDLKSAMEGNRSVTFRKVKVIWIQTYLSSYAAAEV